MDIFFQELDATLTTELQVEQSTQDDNKSGDSSFKSKAEAEAHITASISSLKENLDNKKKELVRYKSLISIHVSFYTSFSIFSLIFYIFLYLVGFYGRDCLQLRETMVKGSRRVTKAAFSRCLIHSYTHTIVKQNTKYAPKPSISLINCLQLNERRCWINNFTAYWNN